MHRFPLFVHGWIQFLSIDIIELLLPYGFLLSFLEWIPMPFLPIICRFGRCVAACSSIGLMIGIQSTGNYAFLNAATCLPCLACLDDSFLCMLTQPVSWLIQPRNAAPAGRCAKLLHLAGVLVAFCLFLTL